ncbi:MAG: germination lipoprotein GerS-related protein [Lutispora sp.]|jgi:outer membrane lipoprotein-sorting protein
MLQKALSIIIIVILIITGCSASKLSAEETLEKMETAESYSCEAKMAVKNNKSIFYYNLKQYYKQQGKFRIEFYDDYGKMKQTMIYNNGQCGIYHAQIDKPFKTQNFADTKEHNSFISAFLVNYRNDPEAKWTKEKIDEEDYYVFQCRIDKENRYFSRVFLLVNVKSAQPQLLYIFDKNDSKTMEVKYKNFKYNDSLDDSLFDME